MMSFTAMAQDMGRAVSEAVADLVRTKRVNGGYFVNLPMLYPDGSFVTVRIVAVSAPAQRQASLRHAIDFQGGRKPDVARLGVRSGP